MCSVVSLKNGRDGHGLPVVLAGVHAPLGHHRRVAHLVEERLQRALDVVACRGSCSSPGASTLGSSAPRTYSWLAQPALPRKAEAARARVASKEREGLIMCVSRAFECVRRRAIIESHRPGARGQRSSEERAGQGNAITPEVTGWSQSKRHVEEEAVVLGAKIRRERRGCGWGRRQHAPRPGDPARAAEERLVGDAVRVLEPRHEPRARPVVERRGDAAGERRDWSPSTDRPRRPETSARWPASRRRGSRPGGCSSTARSTPSGARATTPPMGPEGALPRCS